MKKTLKSIIRSFGFDIIKKRSPLEANLDLDETLGFDDEEAATQCIKIVKNNTMLSKRRLVTLYQQVAYCEKYDIPGSYVECGVWKGGAVGLMALANMQCGKQRRDIHLFDAFQEICEPDAALDGVRALRDVKELTGRSGSDQGRLHPIKGIYDAFGGPGTLEENKLLLEKTIGYEKEFLHYHVGWFQDSIPRVHREIDKIAILRLDGDWYASTQVCLEYLYDKVVRGGIVILDDYGTYAGCKRAVDEYMLKKGIKAYLSHVDSDCRYFINI
jgi:hypothetical protein